MIIHYTVFIKLWFVVWDSAALAATDCVAVGDRASFDFLDGDRDSCYSDTGTGHS